ncbi:MAG TPA: SWIM zinc finger family protein [Coleofasciculaceae cyanobacterium]
MLPIWTTEQILALAPDASSAKNGQALATLRKWSNLGNTEQVLWGECQGSGSKPYQAQIDLTETGFKCSCPSRKFPCKHGLGLFVLFVSQPDAFSDNTPPEWVSNWISARHQKREKKTQLGQATNSAAQAKRASQREDKVTAGVQELERWLRDLVRQGLAAIQTQPYSYWDAVAARMVDAQAPGLARQLREMAGIPHSGEGWQERLLERLGRLHLLIQGFQRLDTLPSATQADIRTLMGWTQKEEFLSSSIVPDRDRSEQGASATPLAFAKHGEPSEAKRGEAQELARRLVADRWSILGQRVEEQDNLRSQRTWLQGQDTGKAALVLNYAYGNQPLDTSLMPGTVIEAELGFFESAYPLRALIKMRHTPPTPLGEMPGEEAIPKALSIYTNALACQPWIEQFPLTLQAIIPLRHNNGWAVRDLAGYLLPLTPRFEQGWQLLALSGGHPINVFGEWNGKEFLPLSALTEGKFIVF